MQYLHCLLMYSDICETAGLLYNSVLTTGPLSNSLCIVHVQVLRGMLGMYVNPSLLSLSRH